ncbi:MAG: DUF2141 domain-containing protein [Cyclobacteriaceae bacterium]
MGVIRVFIAMVSIAFGSTTSLKAQVGDLHIKITDIEEHSGRMQIGIYNDRVDFPTAGKEYKIVYLEVDGNEVIHTIEGLPQGEYAVAFYHDTNMDSICNLNFFGIPKEGYGFSRNYRPKFRAPVFEETVITVGDSTYVEMVPIY